MTRLSRQRTGRTSPVAGRPSKVTRTPVRSVSAYSENVAGSNSPGVAKASTVVMRSPVRGTVFSKTTSVSGLRKVRKPCRVSSPVGWGGAASSM